MTTASSSSTPSSIHSTRDPRVDEWRVELITVSSSIDIGLD